MILLNNYEKTGTTLADFQKEAAYFDERTKLKKIDFSYLRVLDYFKREGDKIVFRPLTDYYFSEKGQFLIPAMVGISIAKLNDNQKKIITEMEHGCKTLFGFTDGVNGNCFLADTIYKTLSARQSALGGKFLKEYSFERNLLLQKVLTEEALEANVLIRSDGRLTKMFAVYGLQKNCFKRFAVSELGKTLELIPELEIKRWVINHKKAEIYAELPRNGKKLIPGVIFRCSDTGYYSTSAMLVWRCPGADYDNYYIQQSLQPEVEKNGELTAEEFAKQTREMISSNLESYYKSFEEKIESKQDILVSLKAIGLAKIAGKKTSGNIHDFVKCKISQNEISTTEDMIYTVMSIPEVFPFPVTLKDEYRKVLNSFLLRGSVW